MDSLTDLDFHVPRSCNACHRKKVKCDRQIPCSTCAKTSAKCTYPPVDQRKKSRRVPVNALLNRLAQLEKKVSTLSKPSDQPIISTPSDQKTNLKEVTPSQTVDPIPQNTHQSIPDGSAGVLLNQGNESRYFGDSFIASLAHDANELSLGGDQQVLDGDNFPTLNQLGANDAISPGNIGQSLSLDPRSGWRALRLWQIYQSNVEPMLKILHIGTTQEQLYAVMQNPQAAGDGFTMLLNAICFAALVSLDDEETQSIFNLDQASLIGHYRSETEKYISKLTLMTASNLEYLQALTIFLTTIRVIDNTRAVWILTGLAIRIAQSLGIHMDGETFNLSPFDCEIRRRLWWHIFLLEIRAGEDQGLRVMDLTSTKYPPKYPSNINDEDIWPGMSVVPTPSKTGTSTTLTLIRIQLADQIIHLGLYSNRDNDKTGMLDSIEQSRQQIRTAYDKIVTEWLSTREHQSQNYYPAAMALLDFSYKKAEFLILFRAYQSNLLDDKAKESIREQAVRNALALMESLNHIETTTSLKRYHWYSKSNPQWFTVGFLLQQLLKGLIKDDSLRRRSQIAIEEVFSLGPGPRRNSIVQRRGAIWVALQLLKDKALARYDTPDSQISATGSNTHSETEIFPTPESVDFEALDSMFDFNDFDFSQLGPTDLSLFDSQINMDMTGFERM